MTPEIILDALALTLPALNREMNPGTAYASA
jgi:hypothetical protein